MNELKNRYKRVFPVSYEDSEIIIKRKHSKQEDIDFALMDVALREYETQMARKLWQLKVDA